MPRRASNPSRSPALFVTFVLVAAGAVLRGGVSVSAVSATAVLSAALLLIVASTRHHQDGAHPDGRFVIPVLVPGLALAATWTLVQLIPLPPSVLRVVARESAGLFERHLAPIGAWPAWRPISLDPGATALELAKILPWTLVLTAAALIAAERSRRDALLRGIALSGPLAVLAVFGNTLLADAPLLEPHFPFPNPNHLAGFLQLAAWPALGFAIRDRGPRRAGWLVAFTFTVAGIFLSLSRAGIAAFFVGTGIFVGLYLRSGRRRADVPPLPTWREVTRAGPRAVLRAVSSRSAALVPVAISAALALAAYLALDRVVTELRTISEASTTAVKLGVWPPAARMIAAHPLTGIGRGAFATAYPAYKSEPVAATFTHVENELLQLPLDLGVPIGVAVIALFTWAWVAAARKDDISRPVIGALAGTAALVAHNVFDFSLEIPGVAIPFSVAMGVVSRDMRFIRVSGRLLSGGAVAGMAVALGCAATYRAHPTTQDAERIASSKSSDEALVIAREVLRWHPADWIPPAVVGGLLAGDFRCDEAEPWLLRAMERNPNASAPHLGAGRCFAVRGKLALAKREYRLAVILGLPDALAEAHALFPAKGELLEVAPDTPDGLIAAAGVLRDSPEEAREAWRRAWESFASVYALAGLADVTVDVGDADEGLRLARKLQEVSPHYPRGYLVAARALDLLGDSPAALRELELGAAKLPGSAEVLVPLGNRHLQQRRFSQAKSIFESIVAKEGRALAAKRVLVARALEGQDRYQEALREVQVAREIEPTNVSTLETFARLSALVGRYDEAIEALEKAAQAPGADQDSYAARIAELRAARDEQRVRRGTQGLATP